MPTSPSLRLLAVLAVGMGTAYAQTSRITQVTVYPGSASIERTLQIPAGAQQATFACLPAGLDAQTLQVRTNDRIAVGEIAVRQQPRALIAGCAHSQQSRVRELEDKIAALQAEAQGLEQAGAWLNRFEQPTSASQISATADALRRTGQSVAQRQHAINREQEALQAQLDPLLADQERTGGATAQASIVQITVSAPQGGNLALSYQVRGPSWQPGYRAALNVEQQKLTLERTAQVSQNTGEDWRDVALILSTGQPNSAANSPLPRPWRISEAAPANRSPDAELRKPAPAAPVARMLRGAEMATASAPDFDASVFEGSHATTFTLPQRISIPSNAEQLSFSLGQQQLNARLLVRTTPALDTAAYLIASFDLPEDGIWPSGPMRLYRDGAYAGASRLDAQSTAQNGIGFGKDERVSVRALPAETLRGHTGLIGQRQQRVENRTWEVRNNHRTAINLQVLDAAPVSEQQDIRVESSYKPQPSDIAWNGQPGTVLWEKTLPPATSERFSSSHTISWPQDMKLHERR
ncbi:DUF4139 domain-containing protein [Comamonas sp. NoAH]|uniref:DUF4139 domain-containing protein n=1 Tax=Comamonas halotolerans TaxID=3041496 RepID=UPI0024E0D599|nr:DUF4139 domain-containing protein [Comamonas sp. NoAH]